MNEKISLFILAGEHSGDRLAADLVRRLRSRLELKVAGVGGDDLQGEGVRSLFPMSDLSVMGFWDVVRRLPLLLWRVEQTVRAILRGLPDIVVLVDAQEFSKLVAGRLRKKGYTRPILLYVGPSVWGRAPERARKLKPLFDEVLAVLPFEPGVMARLGGPQTSYVGHPALLEAQPRAEEGARRIALLPGSRAGELRRHLPLLQATAESLEAEGGISFFLPTLPGLASGLVEAVRGWGVPVTVVSDRTERLRLYPETMFAITVAGTATLELALAGVPMVATYLMEGPQAREYKRLNHPRVSLPNIILDRDIVPEVLLDRPDPNRLVATAKQLLADPSQRLAQQQAFRTLAQLMADGLPDSPREDPAERVLSHLPAVVLKPAAV